MTIQEAIKSGKPFKRPGYKHWMYVEDNYIYLKSSLKEEIRYILNTKEILADNWEVKEEWYEGDFKKKYPNGVLCWVWDTNNKPKCFKVITNYVKDDEYPFKSYYGNYNDLLEYKHAEPIKPEEAPAIIGDSNG